MVRDVAADFRREERTFKRLTLADRTGSVTAILPADVPDADELARTGTVVRVRGRYAVDPRFGGQLMVESIAAAQAGDFDPAELQDGPARSVAQMEADLRELLATVHNPHLRRLLDRLLGAESPIWALYRDAPAAKRYHQAYRHGLLEHCLTVAQAVGAISATFPGIDRDLAVTGALLHDIGKLEVYEFSGGAIEMSDRGRLQGEIPLGYYRIRAMIERLENFPAELAQAVLHIILSHHGSLEHGSPVVPSTREATLVHMMDNLGGRLGSFDRLEKELPDGRRWSPYDRALGGGAYFAASSGGDAGAAGDTKDSGPARGAQPSANGSAGAA
ncbi:MAG: 3-5 exoribonuclease, partial [Solirubrobacteraceae bacterium]|nr:3-5 exoribonuclease [Solirubrobacteraceae bacterium]